MKEERITVDGNKSVIALQSGDDDTTYKGRTLTHYTTNDALYSILKFKEFRAHQVREYKSQNYCVKNKAILDTVFSVSFSKSLGENAKMWKDVKKDVQVKVDFIFIENSHDFINHEEPFHLYESQCSKNPIETFSSVYPVRKSFQRTKPISVSSRLIVDRYVSEDEVTSGMLKNGEALGEELLIDGVCCSIIQGTGTHDLLKWEYQDEVKLVAYLQSTSPVQIKNCEWLGIPIKYDSIETVKITFRRKDSTQSSQQDNLIELSKRIFGEKLIWGYSELDLDKNE